MHVIALVLNVLIWRRNSDVMSTGTARIQQQLHQQLGFRLVIGLLCALCINVLFIYVLSLAIQQRPDETLAKRIYQVQLAPPPPQPTPVQQQQRAEKKQNIEKALSSVVPQTRLTAQHSFSMPAQLVETAVPAQWTQKMDIGAIEIGAVAIQIDKHARLKYLPNLERYYPREAKRKRISGETTLELSIGLDGRVVEHRIIQSEPSGVFEAAIPALIPEIRYEPAESAGQKVTEKRRLKLKWSLK